MGVFDMQAIGGLLGLFILATAFMAMVYFILEPLVCWTLVLIALAIKALFK
jgi:cytochrome c oxidase subunit IV